MALSEPPACKQPIRRPEIPPDLVMLHVAENPCEGQEPGREPVSAEELVGWRFILRGGTSGSAAPLP